MTHTKDGEPLLADTHINQTDLFMRAQNIHRTESSYVPTKRRRLPCIARKLWSSA